jgi:hypothetical protein
MSIFKSGGPSRSETAAIVSGAVGVALWIASAFVRSDTETRKREFDSELDRRLRAAGVRSPHARKHRKGT